MKDVSIQRRFKVRELPFAWLADVDSAVRH